MKSLTSFLQRALNRQTIIVPQQMELPLGGIRLNKEEAKFTLDLRRLRNELAKA